MRKKEEETIELIQMNIFQKKNTGMKNSDWLHFSDKSLGEAASVGPATLCTAPVAYPRYPRTKTEVFHEGLLQ